MGYQPALEKAWQTLHQVHPPRIVPVMFLGEEYRIDCEMQSVIPASAERQVKDYTIVLLLHYLAASLRGLPALSGTWRSFKEISGIEGYQQTFRQRVINTLIHKWPRDAAGVSGVLERLHARVVPQADEAFCVEAFAGVELLLLFWRSDGEFPAEATVLFDKNITSIFCIEDIIVLAEMVAHRL